MTTKSETLNRIRAAGVIPVIRTDSFEDASRLIDAIFEGGITVFEVTMTVPDAVNLIEKLVNRFGDAALIGAGTVLDTRAAADCISAGARFVVSPALGPPTVEFCRRKDTVCFPGVLTPTEVVTAWRAGADAVKIFPCHAMGGPAYLRSLKAPFPNIDMMPTGGVNLSNVADYFAAGAMAVGVGSELAAVRALREGRRDAIVEAARAFTEAAGCSSSREVSDQSVSAVP